ncbi:MAG: arginine deiminase family protein, partial [Desulfobacterales bacterium]
MFTHAIARKPGKNFAQGLTTTASDTPPRYELLQKQHETYLDVIKSCGLEVTLLDPLPDFPDAYFVEDTAVVTPDVAIITNPGAKARKGESDFMAPVLAKFRKTERILTPGTVDGGDVLQVGNHFFIGLSERTNKEGAAQLGRILESYGNSWATVEVGDGLHFKSSVNYVGQNTLLVTANFADHAALSEYNKIILEKAEAYAANTLLLNRHLLMPAGFPGTRKQLEALGFDIIELETSEVQKMDGGLTCMSLR